MSKYIKFYLDRDDFDQRLGGGIPKGSLVIIEGEEGAGKSIVTQRILYGALKNGHTATYISTEMNIIDFVRQMESLNYPIESYMLEDKLLFITLVNLFGKVKKGKNIFFELTKPKAKRLFQKELFILDSLAYPLVNNISLREIEQIVEFLLRVKSNDITIVITFDPEQIDSRLAAHLRRVADIYFKVEIKTLAGQLIRALEVKRFRNPMGIYNMLVPFRVEPGLGLIVEIVTIV